MEDLYKILIALFLGGTIGLERQLRDKAAGFRTTIIICVGTTLFTILSQDVLGTIDPSRIAASIVQGIGFLGAGVILHYKGHVLGMTTAATIWLVAAIGMSVGLGFYLLAFYTSAISLFVLWIFPFVERQLSKYKETIIYNVVSENTNEIYDEINATFQNCNLKVIRHNKSKKDDLLFTFWEVSGKNSSHNQINEQLMKNSNVKEFSIL